MPVVEWFVSKAILCIHVRKASLARKSLEIDAHSVTYGPCTGAPFVQSKNISS